MSRELRAIEDDRLPFGEANCVIIAADSAEAALDELAAIADRLSDFIEEHPEIDEDEPWFGFAFKIAGEVLLEPDLYAKVIEQASAGDKIERLVRAVIAFNTASGGDPALYVNEELEAGSNAIEALLGADLERYLPLYLEYLSAIDLDHTVEQHDLAGRLGERLDDAQRARLVAHLETLSSGAILIELLG